MAWSEAVDAAVQRKIQRALGVLVMHHAPLNGEPRLSMAGLLLFRLIAVSSWIGARNAVVYVYWASVRQVCLPFCR